MYNALLFFRFYAHFLFFILVSGLVNSNHFISFLSCLTQGISPIILLYKGHTQSVMAWNYISAKHIKGYKCMGILDKFKKKKETNEPPQQEVQGENSEAPAGTPFQKHLMPCILAKRTPGITEH